MSIAKMISGSNLFQISNIRKQEPSRVRLGCNNVTSVPRVSDQVLAEHSSPAESRDGLERGGIGRP